MIPTVLEKCGYERQEEGMIPTVLEKRGYERQEEGMIPTALEKRGYERQEEGMIPMEHEKCGYERQEEGMIPTVLEKRGYERQEEGMIPMAFEKRGYERQEETEIPSLLRKYGDMQYNNRRENHMFANYWEIQNRVKYIKEELSHIEAVEKEMPAGELIVAKNNKNYKWYFHNQNTTIYLPKKEIELAKKLTLKKYYQLRKEELQRELQACQMYMQKADCKKDMLEKMLDNEEYERLLGGRRHSVKKELENWMNEKYEKNGSHPENLIVKGTQGKFLRSKSEAIIDKVLYTNGIPFRYEDKLVLENTFLYPDFTARHPKTGQVYYWEHFGLMDQPEYINRACQKIKMYCENGIIPGINLILTYETKENPLSIDQVEKIVKEYFL